MHTHPMEQSSFLPLKYITPKYILGEKKKKKASITFTMQTGE